MQALGAVKICRDMWRVVCQNKLRPFCLMTATAIVACTLNVPMFVGPSPLLSWDTCWRAWSLRFCLYRVSDIRGSTFKVRTRCSTRGSQTVGPYLQKGNAYSHSPTPKGRAQESALNPAVSPSTSSFKDQG